MPNNKNFVSYGNAENLVQGIADKQIQRVTMPAASVDLVGRIYQYVGATNANYTHNYFYECIADTSTTPTTYKWEQTDVQPGGDGVLTMSKSAFDAAKAAGTLPHNETIIIPDDNGDVTNQIWIGTTAEHTAAETADTLPYNAIIGITENDGSGIVWYSRDDEGTETPFGSGGSARELKTITTANDFRIASGAYSFVTVSAVTITLADANTITIPANTIGFFDISETDDTLDDYTGIIQYKANDRDKIIYFNSTSFTLPATDNVEIDDTTASTTSTYSSSKIETIIGGSRASQMTGATSYQDGKAGLVTQPKAGDNQKFLCGDGRYHNIYSAETGSVVVAVTDEETLIGRPVTLTAGATTLTGTFDSNGECVFNNLALYGAVQIACEDEEGNPARGSTNISYFGTYVVGVGLNFATIKFTSSDISLAGVPVAIYKGDVLVTETSLRVVGSGQLEAVAYVEELGVYKALAETTEGKARASIKVTALRQEYTAELIVANIYGFQIDHTDSNPATCVQPYSLGDYEVLNAEYTPAHMDYTNDVFNYGSWTGLATCDRNEIFFAPKPCMLRYDGTVDYYLDPNDYTKKLDGSASDVADLTYEGNCMVEFPTIYFKRWMVDDMEYVLIADKQVDMDFYAYAHHDVNGNVLPYIYLSAYDGCYDGTRMRSISGCGYTASLSSGNVICQTTRQQEIDFAQANNLTGYTGEGWYLRHKADWDMVNDLLILIGMSTNTQIIFGRGNDSRGQRGCIGTGTMDDKGMFWGSNDGTSGVKVFYIENWWANIWVSVAGWTNYYGTQKVKMTYGQEDGSTTDGFNLDGTGYVAIPNSTPTGTSGGYINSYFISEYGLIPKNVSGSDSTYLCDGMWSVNSQIDYSLVGDTSSDGTHAGAFCVTFNDAPTIPAWYSGSAISYKGIAS